jgi:hypothetical protein
MLMSFAVATAAPVEVPIGKSAKVKALPEMVRHTVLEAGVGATVRDVITETTPEGATVYEVEMRIKGLTRDIVVGSDGTLLVDEQQMTLASLPPAVRATMLKSAGKRQIRIVESVTKVGKLEYYEAHVVSGKTLVEVKVAPDGSIVP